MIKHLKTILFALCATITLQSSAQSYLTYNHDETKMNQVTVQETGTGGLTPAFYYELFHENYQQSAAAKNKLAFRTLAGVAAYPQVSDADSVKAYLEARAKIEALNVADRQIDLAWLAEGTKITNKLNDFQANINRIVSAGGTINDRERWNDYYNMFLCAIKATQEAYMPNAQRKKEYLAIYADITKQNETLIKFIVQANSRSKTAEMLSATYTKPDRKTAIVNAAHNRWRDASWRSAGNNSSGQSGNDNIPENGVITQ